MAEPADWRDFEQLLRLHGSDVIFFGFSTCRMKQVDALVVPFDQLSFREDNTLAGSKAALARRSTLSHLGPEYADLFVVAVPRADIEVERSQRQSVLVPESSALSEPTFEYELQNPLVKSADGSVIALRSGVRSAILPLPGLRLRCMRLKGCGNNYDGFPTRVVRDENGMPILVSGNECHEIRGCCFQHTAAFEQTMSASVGELLVAQQALVGNQPLGWWEYRLQSAPYPAIARCCGLFETLGERRLSDHVLRGIELLLEDIVDMSKFSAEAILPFFPDGVFGPRPADGLSFTEADTTFMQYACGGVDCARSLADISVTLLPLTAERLRARIATLPPALHSIWCESIDEFSSFLSQSSNETQGCSILGYLYAAFGAECALVSKMMYDARVCWGTFRDLTGTHCNAHGNNFVLCLPSKRAQAQRFLAPLDFDFAYPESAFVSEGDKLKDIATAAENIEMERHALAMSLACSSDTTGVKNDHIIPEQVAGLRWALRDTMLKSFLASFDDVSVFKPISTLHAGAYPLLKLALLVTWDVVA